MAWSRDATPPIAIFAFSAASIFRLVFFAISRSVYDNGTL